MTLRWGETGRRGERLFRVGNSATRRRHWASFTIGPSFSPLKACLVKEEAPIDSSRRAGLKKNVWGTYQRGTAVHATPHKQISRRTGFFLWHSASIPPTLLALYGRPCFWQNILTLSTFTGMRVHAQSVYTIRTILQPKLPKYLLITLVTLPVQETREKNIDQQQDNREIRASARPRPGISLPSPSTRPEPVLLILTPPAAQR